MAAFAASCYHRAMHLRLKPQLSAHESYVSTLLMLAMVALCGQISERAHVRETRHRR